jgi:hypothetical protein
MAGRIDPGERMRYLQILAGRRTEVPGVHEASARRTLSGPSMPPALAVIEGRRKLKKSGPGLPVFQIPGNPASARARSASSYD